MGGLKEVQSFISSSYSDTLLSDPPNFAII